MPPAIPAVVAVATAGAAVATVSAQNKAAKAANTANQNAERMAQVNSIVANTNSVIPSDAPEYQDFIKTANENPQGVDVVQAKSTAAISAYEQRIKNQNTQQSSTPAGDVSPLAIPQISSSVLADLNVLRNRIDSINPQQSATKTDYTPLYIVGAVGLGVLLLKKGN